GDLTRVAGRSARARHELAPGFADGPPVPPRDRAAMFGGDGAVGAARRRGDPPGRPYTADTTWRGAAGLAADVRYYGEWMRERAWERIGHLYPTYNGDRKSVV